VSLFRLTGEHYVYIHIYQQTTSLPRAKKVKGPNRVPMLVIPEGKPVLDQAAALEMGMTCVCFNLRKASRRITQLYDAALRPTGLRVTQLTLLAAIRVLEPVSMNGLAGAVVMDRTTLTRNLKPLNKRGLIEIQRGNDQRTRKLTITDEGHRVLVKAFPLWQRAQGRIVRGLGDETWKSLLSGLSALVSTT